MSRLTGETGAICDHGQIAMSCSDCAREREEARKKAEEQQQQEDDD